MGIIRKNAPAGAVPAVRQPDIPYKPGIYKKEAMEFLKETLAGDIYNFIISHESANRHPYVAARIYLEAADWSRFVWIEQHGSLQGYAEETAGNV